MFENYFCDVVRKSPCISDESCATLDTGCQRLAIGKNTLLKLMKHLPNGLHVHLIPAQNTFRSVHGVSSTTKLAAIPCALGPRGCYLRPALFDDGFGIDAPFLISLPFLLKTRGQLVLDQKQGLQLHLNDPKCKINIHLGPSGALRVPLMQFDDEVLRCLKSSQQVLARSEFEIFDLSSGPQLRVGDKAQDCGAFDSPTSLPDPVLRHGGPSEQASTRGACFQCPTRLGAHPSKAALPDLPDDTLAGDFDPPRGQQCRGGDGRHVGHERLQLESSSRRSVVDGRISSPSRVLSDIEGFYIQDNDIERCGRHPRTTSTDWNSTQMSLQPGHEDLDLAHREQPGQDLCSMPQVSGTTMPVLSVVREPTTGRLDSLALQGGHGGQPAESPGDPDGHDPGQVRPQESLETGHQWSPGEEDMQAMPEDLDHQEAASRKADVGINQFQGLRRVPEIHGVETHSRQEVGPKFQRKVHHALKRTVSFWKEIQALFTVCGVDGQTTSDHISCLNHELMDDLIRCPKGTKRTRDIAETMHLAHKDLKVVAEVFNPGCFQSAVHKHGLSHGLAFDLQLGDDLLDDCKQDEVKQYIRDTKPGLTVISPPCEMYSQLQNLLKELRNRKPESMERYLKKKRIADRLLNFAIDVATLCIELNLSFVLEHPWSASSWKTVNMKRLLQLEGVQLSRCDQCMTGLQSENGSLHRKRTGFATNNETIAKALNIPCDKSHQHEHIIGGHRSKFSQVYTENLKERIIKAYKRSIQQALSIRSSHDVVAENAWVDTWMALATTPFEDILEEGPRTEKFSGHHGPQRPDLTRGPLGRREREMPKNDIQDLYPAEVQRSDEVHDRGRLREHRPEGLRDSGQGPHDHDLVPLQPDLPEPSHGALRGQVQQEPDDLQHGQEQPSGQGEAPDPGKRLPGQRPVSLNRLIQRAHEGLFGSPTQRTVFEDSSFFQC